MKKQMNWIMQFEIKAQIQMEICINSSIQRVEMPPFQCANFPLNMQAQQESKNLNFILVVF